MVHTLLNTETMNPFSMVEKNQLMIDEYVLESLPSDELINYFVSFIDDTYHYKNERQNMIYNTSIFILTQSLELNLYKDRKNAFTRIFDVLYPVLSK
ncbi:MAG: hypothetical protein JWO58_1216 [Chitinophagaceae bacterium]|nr:hypothetical protein [Chitinophagaceae bacterium]